MSNDPAEAIAASSVTPDEPPTSWRRQNVPFRIVVGGIALGAPRIELDVGWSNGREAPLTRATLAATVTAARPPHDGGHMYAAYPIAERVPTLRIYSGRLVYAPRQYPLYAVDLTIGFEDYLAKFSSKSRSTLRRKIRKFAEKSGGTIDWRQYQTPAEMEEFYRLARALSAQTYQERRLDAGLPESAVFRQGMVGRAAEGRARGYLLFLDGKAVSYIYCPIDDGVLSYEHVGYDAATADLSPGTVLQWQVLEALFKEKRHRLFDFTQGEGDHKRFFSTESRQCANIVVLPPSLRGWSIVLIQFALDQLSNRAARVLDRVGLKRAIRRVLRR